MKFHSENIKIDKNNIFARIDKNPGFSIPCIFDPPPKKKVQKFTFGVSGRTRKTLSHPCKGEKLGTGTRFWVSAPEVGGARWFFWGVDGFPLGPKKSTIFTPRAKNRCWYSSLGGGVSRFSRFSWFSETSIFGGVFSITFYGGDLPDLWRLNGSVCITSYSSSTVCFIIHSIIQSLSIFFDVSYFLSNKNYTYSKAIQIKEHRVLDPLACPRVG